MSNHPFNHPLNWKPLNQWTSPPLSAFWRNWLGDMGSLTERLVQQSQGNFAIEVLSQRKGSPMLAEARVLGLTPRQKTLLREVVLTGNKTPWVFARSVLPLSTLTGRLKKLRQLDNYPLGRVLFNDSSMRRGPIEIALIPSSALPVSLPDCKLWGRRSVFWLDEKPLLVSEIFLPSFAPALP